jgi:hypothetical protein
MLEDAVPYDHGTGRYLGAASLDTDEAIQLEVSLT